MSGFESYGKNFVVHSQMDSEPVELLEIRFNEMEKGSFGNSLGGRVLNRLEFSGEAKDRVVVDIQARSDKAAV